MLNLEELKTALKHDSAQKGRLPPPLPDYAAARSLMLDAILAVEEADLALRERPAAVAPPIALIDGAIAKLHAATRALTPKGSDE